jgi:hypothetical protein
MQEVTADKLQIAYEGPGLKGGRMAMLALGSSLRGQALLILRVKDKRLKERGISNKAARRCYRESLEKGPSRRR